MDGKTLEDALRGLSAEQIQELLRRAGHDDLLAPAVRTRSDTSYSTAEGIAEERHEDQTKKQRSGDGGDGGDGSDGSDGKEQKHEACAALPAADDQRSEDLRKRANACFKARDYLRATELYTEALATAQPSEQQILYNNRAAAYLKLGRHSDAIEDCDRSIAIQPSVKAYLRRADAFMHTDETCHAAEAAMLAHALDPRHTEACELVRVLFHSLTRELQCNPQTRNYDAVCTLRRRMLEDHGQIHWIQSKNKGNPSPPSLTGHIAFKKPGAESVCVCVGGRSGRHEVQQVWEYDALSDFWTTIDVDGVVPPMSWFAACAIESLALCVFHGGLSGCSESRGLRALDFRANPPAWRDVEVVKYSQFDESVGDAEVKDDAPECKSGHSFVLVPSHCLSHLALPEGCECVMSVGGRSRGAVDSQVRVLALRRAGSCILGTWIAVSVHSDAEQDGGTEPAGRDGHVLQWLHTKDACIVFGGNGAVDEIKYNDVWTLHILPDTRRHTLCVHWEHHPISVSPPARSYAASTVCGGCICVCLGRGLDGERYDIWVLDTDTWSWCEVNVETPTQPRAWQGGCRLGAELLCVCGGNAEGPLKSTVRLQLGILSPRS